MKNAGYINSEIADYRRGYINTYGFETEEELAALDSILDCAKRRNLAESKFWSEEGYEAHLEAVWSEIAEIQSYGEIVSYCDTH